MLVLAGDDFLHGWLACGMQAHRRAMLVVKTVVMRLSAMGPGPAAALLLPVPGGEDAVVAASDTVASRAAAGVSEDAPAASQSLAPVSAAEAAATAAATATSGHLDTSAIGGDSRTATSARPLLSTLEQLRGLHALLSVLYGSSDKGGNSLGLLMKNLQHTKAINPGAQKPCDAFKGGSIGAEVLDWERLPTASSRSSRLFSISRHDVIGTPSLHTSGYGEHIGAALLGKGCGNHAIYPLS